MRSAARAGSSARSAWRSGVASLTARTRVGEPVCPKRGSSSSTSPTRSAAVHVSIRPVGSIASTSRFAGQMPSLIPSVTETTAGRSSSYVSKPSSVSRRPRSPPSAASSRSTLVSWPQPRNAAVSAGTCQVSESTVLRPQRTRSAPSFSTASASVREVPIVSATAKTLSFR